MMMGPCRQQCSGRRLTQTGTSILSHTTLWLTRQQWPAPCLLERTGSSRTSHTRQRKRNISPKCWGWMGIPENRSPRTGKPQHTPPTWGVRHTQSQSDPPYYLWHLSEIIRRILTPLGVYTCFRPHHTLCRTLVHLKDCTSFRRQAGVVYRIPCGSCEKMYIGQTGRTLDHRLKEHRRARTPHNEQGWRPITNGVQPTNPTSAPALLKTCCCFYIVLYFLIIIIIYCNLHCAYPNLVLCTACWHFTHHLSSV